MVTTCIHVYTIEWKCLTWRTIGSYQKPKKQYGRKLDKLRTQSSSLQRPMTFTKYYSLKQLIKGTHLLNCFLEFRNRQH